MNDNSAGTIPVKLVGVPACRRYQKMRAAVLNAADHLSVQINIEEVSETEKLAQFNPLSLPRLYIRDELFASQNLPRAQDIERALTSNG